MPAKPNLKKVSTTNLRRVGTRKRVAKVLYDYVDATFGESEPPNLHKIPVPPNQNIRPPKASRTSANADNTFQDCWIGAESSHDNNDGPIFGTQQTSQGTEQWSFRDHNTFSEGKSLALQDSEGSNEDTSASTNFEAERELQEVEKCGYESDSQEQVILPGTSGIVNSHPQLKQNYGSENEAQNHSVIRHYSSRNENPRPKLNQNDGRGMEQQQRVTRPGLSCNENHRPQLNRNDGHGCEPQQQLVVRPGPSRNVNCQR